MKNLLLPKNFLALTLSLIYIISATQFEVTIYRFMVGAGIIIEFLVLRFLKKVPDFFPSATIVSTLIILLLVSPTVPFYVVLTAIAIAILGKYIARSFLNRIIFNPAGAGLFITSFLFNEPVSWWGVSWGYIPLVITLVLVGYLVLFRMKRWAIPLSFLLAYFLLLFILNTQLPSNLIAQLIDPTLIFFSLVMLPEPTTSPNELKKQIFYGIFVAILVFVIGNFVGNTSIDPLIASLLLANLLFKIL